MRESHDLNRNKKIPKAVVISSRLDKGAKGKKRKKKKNVVRGKEVSITESASESQIIYGRMKIGGIVTFVDTNADSAAYLVTGEEPPADQPDKENRIIWTARTAGASGNEITIHLINPGGTNGTTSVSVVGNAIAVTLKCSSGTITATMENVINKIEEDGAANALVKVKKMNSSKNGRVIAHDLTNLSYGGGRYLHQVITIAGHEIESVEGLYLNNELVTFGATPDVRWGTGKWANKVFMAINSGGDDQAAQPDLLVQKPNLWTTAHRQRGNAHVYLILKWDQNLFSDGIPEINFAIRGKKVYDPRSGQTAFSDTASKLIGTNAALVIADYLTNTKYGLGVDWADIDINELMRSANICEEAIPLTAGGTEWRYALEGVFDSSESPSSVLEQMAAAMAGDIVFQEGKWFIYAGVYRPVQVAQEVASAPLGVNYIYVTIPLTIDDLRGNFVVNTHLSRSDTFNSIRGTYVNPSDDYKEADIPAVTNALYVSQDGGVKIWEDVALNFVVSSTQAQRLLKIELERIRQGMTVDWPGTIACARFKVGESIAIDLTRYGWSVKAFEIRQMTFVIDEDGALGIDMHLRETAPEIFDWSLEETTVDLSPNTELPDPSDVEEPTGLTLASGTDELYRRLDGTIFSRLKVSWTVSVSEFVQTGGVYEIQYKKSASAVWTTGIIVPGIQDFHHILDVQDGVSYDVRIRSKNTLNYASDWVTISGHTVIGKTEKPSNVLNFNSLVSDFGIKLSWDGIDDLDLLEYEIRIGTVWETAVKVGVSRSSDGNTFNYEQLSAGVHNFLIKAKDTTKNYSTTATATSATIIGPNPIQGFNIKTVTNNILLDWLTPAPSTLSVNKYLVYKGDDFGTAVLIGTVFGTFHTYIERFGGTFTYWVVAEDVGGNISSEVYAVTNVVPSSDFVIYDDLFLYNSLDSNTHSTLDDDNDTVIAPTLTAGKTWADHFEDYTFTTIQDFIDDGYVSYLEPSDDSNTSVIIYKVDYGVTFPSSFIDFSWIEDALNGTCTVTPEIRTSPDDITYDTFTASQAFAENFRYVEYQLSISADTDDKDLIAISFARAILQVQRAEESQIITTDGSGEATVTFTNTFLDVEDIQVSANSAVVAIPYYAYPFATVPAQQTVDIFTVDIDGNPLASVQVTVTIKGIIGV